MKYLPGLPSLLCPESSNVEPGCLNVRGPKTEEATGAGACSGGGGCEPASLLAISSCVYVWAAKVSDTNCFGQQYWQGGRKIRQNVLPDGASTRVAFSLARYLTPLSRTCPPRLIDSDAPDSCLTVIEASRAASCRRHSHFACRTTAVRCVVVAAAVRVERMETSAVVSIANTTTATDSAKTTTPELLWQN